MTGTNLLSRGVYRYISLVLICWSAETHNTSVKRKFVHKGNGFLSEGIHYFDRKREEKVGVVQHDTIIIGIFDVAFVQQNEPLLRRIEG